MAAWPFTCLAVHSKAAANLCQFVFEGGDPCISVLCRRGKHPSSWFGFFRTLSRLEAAITHTTTNLNLRAGPGTHHRLVKAIIPAGAPIDIRKLRGRLVLHGLGWTCRVRQTSIPDAPRDSRSAAMLVST